MNRDLSGQGGLFPVELAIQQHTGGPRAPSDEALSPSKGFRVESVPARPALHG